jgi:hypothetical protein
MRTTSTVTRSCSILQMTAVVADTVAPQTGIGSVKRFAYSMWVRGNSLLQVIGNTSLSLGIQPAEIVCSALVQSNRPA